MSEKQERKGFYSREEVAAVLKDFQEKNNQAVAKSTGNSAKMREALEAAKKFVDGVGQAALGDEIDTMTICQCAAKLSGRIESALAEPPRNCDRFNTLEDALAGWREVRPDESGPFDNWLFADAKGDVE